MIAAQRHAGLKRSLAVRNGASRGSAKIRPLASAAMANATDLSTCDEAISPACIRALYKIPFNHTFTPHPNNSLGIFEEGNYYSQADLDLFFAEYAPWIPQGTSPVPAFIDGAVAPVPTASGGPESDLDFDMAYPIVYPQTITLYQTDDLYWAANKSNLTGNGVFTGPYGGFNTFLDGIDGVRPSSLKVGRSLIESSRTAPTPPTVRLVTTHISTPSTPMTSCLTAIRVRPCAASTSQRLSFLSPTLARKTMYQNITRSANATST